MMNRLFQGILADMGLALEQNQPLDNYPEELLKYMQTDEKQLAADLESTVRSLRGGTEMPTNAFTKAMAVACIRSIGPVLDEYGVEFFLATQETRQKQVKNIFGQSHLGKALREILTTQNLHTINAHIERFVRAILGSEPVRVQLATDIEPAQKQRIRADLGKAHNSAFVIFRIDATLLGGMRLFADGEMYDMSWLTRVKRLLSA